VGREINENTKQMRETDHITIPMTIVTSYVAGKQKIVSYSYLSSTPK